MFFFKEYGDRRDLPSFPTRRSSDLGLPATGSARRRAPRLDRLRCEPHGEAAASPKSGIVLGPVLDPVLLRRNVMPTIGIGLDRKSTRLNSSHANISYAVFCLKK